MEFNKENSERYLFRLSEKLCHRNTCVELLVFSGQIMTLFYTSKPDTKYIDKIFLAKREFQRTVTDIRFHYNLPEDWLEKRINDYLLSEQFAPHQVIDFSNLKAFTPIPNYILAIKTISLITEADSDDIMDMKFLIKQLKIKSLEEILSVVKYYYPKKEIPEESRLYFLKILKSFF